MAVARASSAEDVRTGITDPHTFTFTPVGVPKGIAIYIAHGVSATSLVTSVSYGGVALTKIVGTFDDVTEPGVAEFWYLGEGIPTGAQTVSIDLTSASTTDIHTVVWEISATGDTEVIDYAYLNQDVANPTIAMRSHGTSKLTLAGMYGGGAAPGGTLAADNTLDFTEDLGNFYSQTCYETTVDNADHTIGWSTLASDDVAFVAIAIAEQSDAPGYMARTTTNSIINTPDHASFDLSTDVDIRACALTWVRWNVPGSFNLLARRDSAAATNLSYRLYVFRSAGNNFINLNWKEAGGTERTAQSTSNVETGGIKVGALWVRATLDLTNGAQYEVKFYTSQTDSILADPDTVTWVQFGSTITGATGPTSTFAGTSPIELGAYDDGTTEKLNGRIYYASLQSGIAGTLIVNPDFRYDTQQDSSTQLTDDQGRVWTINSPAVWEHPLTSSSPGNVSPAVIDRAFTVPTPTVLAASTVTPTVVAVVSTVPTPTVLAAAKPTPTVVAVVSTVPTPTVLAASVVTPAAVVTTTTVPTPTVTIPFTVTPAVVATVTTVPSPTVTAASTVTPLVVAGAFTVPSPTITAASVVTPTVVAAVTTVPTPTVVSPFTVTPTVVATTTTVPTPTVTAASTVTPATVTAVTTVPTPVIAAASVVTPATVASVTTIPAPTILAAATVTPLTVAAATTIPTPTISIPFTVTPTVVSTVTTVPTPTVTISATVTPAAVASVTTIPTPTVTAASVVAPATVATSTTVPTPAILTAGVAAPDTVLTTVTVPTPTVLAESVVAPAVVATVVDVPTPSTAIGAEVAPDTVPVVLTIPTPSVVAESVVSPDVVATVITVPIPVAQGGTTVQPAVIVTTTTVPTPTVTAAATVSPAAVSTVTTVPTPDVLTAGAVVPATVTVDTTIPTPTVQAEALTQPAVVGMTVTVPDPTVTGGTTAQPATVDLTTTIPTPTVTIVQSGVATPGAVNVVVTVPTPTIDVPPVAIWVGYGDSTIVGYQSAATIRRRTSRHLVGQTSRRIL